MSRALAGFVAAAVLCVAAAPSPAATVETPRKILALVDARTEAPPLTETRKVLALVDIREEETVRLTRIHSMAEMPLNHLGLDVVYWDVGKGLPDLAQWPDLRGVLTWFANDPFHNPRDYIAWMAAAMDRGLKVAVLGQSGVRRSRDGATTPMALVNRFFGRLGVRDEEGYSDLNHNARIVVADDVVGFERKLAGVLPGYTLMRPVDARVKSHLVLRRGGNAETDSHLVATGPAGGYAAEGFVRYYDLEFNRRSWIINPFEFFRLAFATDDLPKPDVTTLSGRRLYFSHIDGDGWRNISEVQPYTKLKALSSEVVRRELIEAYPDLPVSVAPIVGDLHPEIAGTEATMDVARKTFALPQVEVASHTWSHPFYWDYYRDYDPADEARFKTAPHGKSGSGWLSYMLGKEPPLQIDAGGAAGGAEGDPEGGIGRYRLPRAYLRTPFNLDDETGGSLRYMDRFAPEGKAAARLYQWSGDTSPWDGAVAAVRKAGGVNMNGGDTRFDSEYPSYTAVSSIGRPVGAERQIYSGSSNENTYTDLWTAKFFGFQNLVHTVKATETPIRVKPFNIYYHTYSGQKTASLNAVKKNLNAARAMELTPVAASHYVDIANGFYSTRFVADGPRRWRVLDRGALQTIRFDRALFSGVDFPRSRGVLGQRYHQGSLYVALDPAEREPIIALTDVDRADAPPDAPRPYLSHGRWVFSDLRLSGQSFTVRAQGYGAGAMEWRVPWAGRYAVTARRGGEILWRGVASVAPGEQMLRAVVAADAIQPLEISVAPLAEGG